MASSAGTISRRYVEDQYFDKVVIADVFDFRLTRTSEQIGGEVEALPESNNFIKIEVHADHTPFICLLDGYSQPSKIFIHIKSIGWKH